MSGTTQHLLDLRAGDAGAADRLFPLVYDELKEVARALFRHWSPDQTLQPTALVHEAYVKLVDQTQMQWTDRAHFMSIAARAMRRVLIDHARRRGAAKRGRGWQRVTIDQPGDAGSADRLDVLALDEALTTLAAIDDRQARVVEMRFFGGLSVQETAAVLDVSPRTVESDWNMAKAWLSRALSRQDPT